MASSYRVLIEPDEDGWYVTSVPELPGCVSQGRGLVAAVRNTADAIDAWLDVAAEEGARCGPS